MNFFQRSSSILFLVILVTIGGAYSASGTSTSIITIRNGYMRSLRSMDSLIRVEGIDDTISIYDTTFRWGTIGDGSVIYTSECPGVNLNRTTFSGIGTGGVTKDGFLVGLRRYNGMLEGVDFENVLVENVNNRYSMFDVDSVRFPLGERINGLILRNTGTTPVLRDDENLIDILYNTGESCNVEVLPLPAPAVTRVPPGNSTTPAMMCPVGRYTPMFLMRDLCDVFGGDGSTCVDCAGIPNGQGTIDICGVCNGAGDTCESSGISPTNSIISAASVTRLQALREVAILNAPLTIDVVARNMNGDDFMITEAVRNAFTLSVSYATATEENFSLGASSMLGNVATFMVPASAFRIRGTYTFTVWLNIGGTNIMVGAVNISLTSFPASIELVGSDGVPLVPPFSETQQLLPHTEIVVYSFRAYDRFENPIGDIPIDVDVAGVITSTSVTSLIYNVPLSIDQAGIYDVFVLGFTDSLFTYRRSRVDPPTVTSATLTDLRTLTITFSDIPTFRTILNSDTLTCQVLFSNLACGVGRFDFVSPTTISVISTVDVDIVGPLLVRGGVIFGFGGSGRTSSIPDGTRVTVTEILDETPPTALIIGRTNVPTCSIRDIVLDGGRSLGNRLRYSWSLSRENQDAIPTTRPTTGSMFTLDNDLVSSGNDVIVTLNVTTPAGISSIDTLQLTRADGAFVQLILPPMLTLRRTERVRISARVSSPSCVNNVLSEQETTLSWSIREVGGTEDLVIPFLTGLRRQSFATSPAELGLQPTRNYILRLQATQGTATTPTVPIVSRELVIVPDVFDIIVPGQILGRFDTGGMVTANVVGTWADGPTATFAWSCMGCAMGITSTTNSFPTGVFGDVFGNFTLTVNGTLQYDDGTIAMVTRTFTVLRRLTFVDLTHTFSTDVRRIDGSQPFTLTVGGGAGFATYTHTLSSLTLGREILLTTTVVVNDADRSILKFRPGGLTAGQEYEILTTVSNGLVSGYAASTFVVGAAPVISEVTVSQRTVALNALDDLVITITADATVGGGLLSYAVNLGDRVAARSDGNTFVGTALPRVRAGTYSLSVRVCQSVVFCTMMDAGEIVFMGQINRTGDEFITGVQNALAVQDTYAAIVELFGAQELLREQATVIRARVDCALYMEDRILIDGTFASYTSLLQLTPDFDRELMQLLDNVNFEIGTELDTVLEPFVRAFDTYVRGLSLTTSDEIDTVIGYNGELGILVQGLGTCNVSIVTDESRRQLLEIVGELEDYLGVLRARETVCGETRKYILIGAIGETIPYFGISRLVSGDTVSLLSGRVTFPVGTDGCANAFGVYYTFYELFSTMVPGGNVLVPSLSTQRVFGLYQYEGAMNTLSNFASNDTMVRYDLRSRPTGAADAIETCLGIAADGNSSTLYPDEGTSVSSVLCDGRDGAVYGAYVCPPARFALASADSCVGCLSSSDCTSTSTSAVSMFCSSSNECELVLADGISCTGASECSSGVCGSGGVCIAPAVIQNAFGIPVIVGIAVASVAVVILSIVLWRQCTSSNGKMQKVGAEFSMEDEEQEYTVSHSLTEGMETYGGTATLNASGTATSTI